ncbi:hypothetical protein [Raoultella terrigena]|uniref:hypothetical protein n=1 Tax=Raoultella terrigena TaxID=577 RepID=UPI001F327EC5|nr:hypothetical protein [Raoultella terrigena]
MMIKQFLQDQGFNVIFLTFDSHNQSKKGVSIFSLNPVSLCGCPSRELSFFLGLWVFCFRPFSTLARSAGIDRGRFAALAVKPPFATALTKLINSLL